MCFEEPMKTQIGQQLRLAPLSSTLKSISVCHQLSVLGPPTNAGADGGTLSLYLSRTPEHVCQSKPLSAADTVSRLPQM